MLAATLILYNCKQKTEIPDFSANRVLSQDNQRFHAHVQIKTESVSLITPLGLLRGIVTRHVFATRQDAEKKYREMLPESQVSLEQNGTSGKGSCSSKACWILSGREAQHILFYPEKLQWESLNNEEVQQIETEIQKWASSRIGYSFP